MPSWVPGNRFCTACASTCAVECLSTARPSGLSALTASTASPSRSTYARSLSSPPTRATTTDLSSSSSAAVVPSGTDRSRPDRTTETLADMGGSYRGGAGCLASVNPSDAVGVHGVQPAVDGHREERATTALAEGGEPLRAEGAHLAAVATPIDPDATALEVAVDVQAAQLLGVLHPAIDVAADDRLPEAVAVLDRRRVVRHLGRAAVRLVEVLALTARPAEVPPLLGIGDA